jgi:hypothetical protein
MKNFFFLAVVTALVFCFNSCNKDDDHLKTDENGTTLKIRTQIADIDAFGTRASLVSNFPEDANMGLYVTSGSPDAIYDSYKDNANVLSILKNGNWIQNPEIRLTGKNATVYAYYPYSSDNKDGRAILVNHNSQQDYMYGTHTPGQAAINKNNRVVNLTMKHALALVQFNIRKVNYPWEGRLTRIEIANAENKTVIFSEGTMDISTGIIKNREGKNREACLKAYSGVYPLLTISDRLLQNEVDFLKIFVLPVAATASEGDVLFKFTIDERVYTWKVPAGTAWRGGTKNTYTVTLGGSSLKIGNVSIEDWTGGVSANFNIAD